MPDESLTLCLEGLASRVAEIERRVRFEGDAAVREWVEALEQRVQALELGQEP